MGRATREAVRGLDFQQPNAPEAAAQGMRSIQDVNGTLASVDDGGTSVGIMSWNAKLIDAAVLRGFALTGMDPNHSQVIGIGDTIANYGIRGASANLPTFPAEVCGGFYSTGTADVIARGSGAAATQNAQRLVTLDENMAWWCGAWLRMTTITNNGFWLIGMLDPTQATPGCVAAGFEAIGATQYVYAGFKRTAAAAVNESPSTVSTDGDDHFVECWSDGSGSYRFSVDAEPAVVFANTNPIGGLLAAPGILWSPGASAAQVTLPITIVPAGV